MSLPVRPVKVTAKGCPEDEVLVAQQIPRRAEAVRLRLSRLTRCRSPNLRLAWAARRRPPKRRASCVGQDVSDKVRSQAHRAARGSGKASFLSLNSLSVLKAEIRGLPSRSLRQGNSAMRASHERAFKACFGASLQEERSCLWDSAQACK